ncbi:MAG: 7TM-DISM domain-containing protein, partial [Flammeovirgaceae bacterium]
MLLASLLLWVPSSIYAGQYVITELKDSYDDLGRALEVLEDQDHSLSLEDIQSGRFNERFFYQSNPEQQLNPYSTYWGKITLNNQVQKDAEWILYPGYKEYVDVFIEQPDGSFIEKKAGFFEDLENKEIKKGREAKVSLFLKYQERKTIYIRIRNVSGFQPNFKIALTTPSKFHKKIESRNYTQGLFQGLMGILILYNFLIFVLNRD